MAVLPCLGKKTIDSSSAKSGVPKAFPTNFYHLPSHTTQAPLNKHLVHFFLAMTMFSRDFNDLKYLLPNT